LSLSIYLVVTNSSINDKQHKKQSLSQIQQSINKEEIRTYLKSKDAKLIEKALGNISTAKLIEFIEDVKNIDTSFLSGVYGRSSYYHSDREALDMSIEGTIRVLEEKLILDSLSNKDSFLSVSKKVKDNIITITLENISSKSIYVVITGYCGIHNENNEIRFIHYYNRTPKKNYELKLLAPKEKYTFVGDYYSAFSSYSFAEEYIKSNHINKVTIAQGYIIKSDYYETIPLEDFLSKQKIIYTVLRGK